MGGLIRDSGWDFGRTRKPAEMEMSSPWFSLVIFMNSINIFLACLDFYNKSYLVGGLQEFYFSQYQMLGVQSPVINRLIVLPENWFSGKQTKLLVVSLCLMPESLSVLIKKSPTQVFFLVRALIHSWGPHPHDFTSQSSAS